MPVRSDCVVIGTMILKTEVPILEKRAHSLGYNGKSEYLRGLIRADLHQSGQGKS